MSSRRLSSAAQAGFTLIEVMISMVIIAFISLGIYQMTTETYRLRDVLSAEGEFYNGIRMAMDVLKLDLANIYSPSMSRPAEKRPRNPNQPPAPLSPEDQRIMEQIMASDAGRTSTFWLAATDKTGIRLSRFVGTENKMTFVSASHTRIYKDSPESIFAKITYETQREGSNPEFQEWRDTVTLVKTEDTNVFSDDERNEKKFKHTYPLLHGLKRIKFRYWNKARDRWDTSWDTDKEDYKGIYPDLIEVTFEAVGPQRLSFDGIYKFRPEVPLRALNPSF